jgi:F0F1-type ATP synthase beta subunit
MSSVSSKGRSSKRNIIITSIHDSLNELEYDYFAGEPIDERGPITTDKFAPIHAEAPAFTEMSVEQEILVTGIKVVDLLAPYAKGGKIGELNNIGTLTKDTGNSEPGNIHAAIFFK